MPLLQQPVGPPPQQAMLLEAARRGAAAAAAAAAKAAADADAAVQAARFAELQAAAIAAQPNRTAASSADAPRSKVAAQTARSRSVSASSSGSTGSRTSDRLSDKGAKASQLQPHFGVAVKKVHSTTTGTDRRNNDRPNALTTVAGVDAGDVILDMWLPCEACGGGRRRKYERVYEEKYPQPTVQFGADGGTCFAELIGPAPPLTPGQCEVSLAYFANDATPAASATARLKIVSLGAGTCRLVMTAIKPLKPGEEVTWTYSDGNTAPSYQSGLAGAPVYTEALLRRVIAVMPSGAGVTEVQLTSKPVAGNGACFYSMFALLLSSRGKVTFTPRSLRKQLSDYLLKEPPKEAVDGFQSWLDSVGDGPIPPSLQTYRRPDEKLTMEDYAKRILIAANYATEFDIEWLLRLHKVNLGIVAYFPKGAKGAGFDVKPEVVLAGGDGYEMMWCSYVRHPSNSDYRNHWDPLVPPTRPETAAFGNSNTVKLSWFGLLQPDSPSSPALTSTTAPATLPSTEQAPKVASAADVEQAHEVASSAAVVSAAAAAAAVTIPIPANPTGAGKGKGKGKAKAKRPASPTPCSDRASVAKRTRLAAIAVVDGTTDDEACAKEWESRHRREDIAAKVQFASDESAAKRLRDTESAARNAREKRPRNAATKIPE